MQYMNFNEGFSMYYDISLDLPWPCNNFVERKGSKASFLYILKKRRKKKEEETGGLEFGLGGAWFVVWREDGRQRLRPSQ
jgi:hypothetical protein